MKDVLQQLSDVIEHRNEETLDIKPFISESLSMTEEFNPKAHMVTQKRFGNKYTISYKKTTSYLQSKEYLSLVVPLSFTKQHYICSATIMGIDRLYVTCSTWYTAR